MPAPKVLVTNQFGSATLYLRQPNLLCLPSWKSMTGPPKLKPTTPPGLNHFTLLPGEGHDWGIQDPAGGAAEGPVRAGRRFRCRSTRCRKSSVCPTTKIVKTATGTKTYPIIDPKTHLLCFAGVKTPIKPKVYDENQFGTSVVHIRIAKWLCLPSTKQVLT